MKIITLCCFTWLSSLVLAGDFATDKLDNWPHWRGPLANGTAPKSDPPTTWDDKTNVKWKAGSQTLAAGDVAFVRSLGAFVSADISTKSAGFRTTPCYFVEIRGKKPYDPGASSTFIVDGVAAVTKAEATAFSIEVDVLVQRLTGGLGVKIDVLTFDGWQVTWMGVEG